MSRARIHLKNLTANWVGFGLNLLVIFFMSPFVVHTLGDVNYGVWSVMMSLSGSLGLIEMGTGAGIDRHITYYLGKDDIPGVNAILSTGLLIIMCVAMFLLATSGVVAVGLPWIFPKIPVELIPTARVITLLLAANIWLGFLSAPFRQLLQAHERYELTNAVELLILLFRTACSFVALSAGYGLLTLAMIHLVANLLGQIAFQILARRVFPAIQISRSLISKEHFRELLGFSVWAFLGAVAWRLLYSADAIVIAILLGPRLVTYYTVGGMLVIRALAITRNATSVFRPQIIKGCARQDWEMLRRYIRLSCNTTMAVSILLLVGMVAFGREFIRLWMGPEFDISYTILVLLATSALPQTASSGVQPLYGGMNRVKLSACLAFFQGILNLGLTLFCVIGLEMGIEGVAWGTFYPRIIFGLVALIIALRWIGISPITFLATSGLKWVLLGSTFFAVCFFIRWLMPPANWKDFFLNVAIASACYLPLAYALLTDADMRDRLWSGLRRNRQKNTASPSSPSRSLQTNIDAPAANGIGAPLTKSVVTLGATNSEANHSD